MSKRTRKAWVVAADMGYGHQRAAFPLRFLNNGEIINANNYQGIPPSERKIWQEGRIFYEIISRFKAIPGIGNWLFSLYDRLQAIPGFYPRRDLSKPSLQVLEIERLIRKKQWGRHLIDKLQKENIPIVTTYFVPAMMADMFNYPGEIYCLATDTDISRAWVRSKPNMSRIKYLAPNYRVVERLRLYGVPSDKIFLTGFPLPQENLGTAEGLEILTNDMKHRIKNLDPKGVYWKEYSTVFQHYIKCQGCLPPESNHPLTLTFAVGGAGAQRELGATIMQSLRKAVIRGQIRLVLVAGIHNSVYNFFKESAIKMGLRQYLGSRVVIIHAEDKYTYFNKFNHILRTTDILWTKPSELSFYVALGIPMIMSEPIGSQEQFNQNWVETIGAGMKQMDPALTNEWLFDLLDSGWLAEAAMEGFIEAPKYGTYNIEKIIEQKLEEVKELKTVLQF